jgi:hypothetical protein
MGWEVAGGADAACRGLAAAWPELCWRCSTDTPRRPGVPGPGSDPSSALTPPVTAPIASRAAAPAAGAPIAPDVLAIDLVAGFVMRC